MEILRDILNPILSVAYFIIIAHIIMSWLVTFNVLNIRQPLVSQIYHGLNNLLEPLYGPIRRLIPATGGLDFAPLVVFIGIVILRNLIN